MFQEVADFPCFARKAKEARDAMIGRAKQGGVIFVIMMLRPRFALRSYQWKYETR